MYAFLCADRKPVTKEARGHIQYEGDIKAAFRQYWPFAITQNGQFYGIVYYFHRVSNQIDADNLSKPVFDALKNELYTDDKFLKVVRSGIFDLTANGIEVLNLTKVPDNVFSDFLRALDRSDHILYIEVGDLDYGMFEFGCER